MLQFAGNRDTFLTIFLVVHFRHPKCKGITKPYLVKFHASCQKRMPDCRKYWSVVVKIPGGEPTPSPIRAFPDHATFREKGAKLACADKLGVFLSLTLCN